MTEPSSRPFGELHAILDAVEVPVLAEVLAAGSLTETVGIEDQEKYAKVAAVNLYGDLAALVKDGDHPRGMIGGVFVTLMASALSADGPCRMDDEKRVWVTHPFGGEVECTQNSLRHWVWMVELMGDDSICSGFLDAVPNVVRDAAMDTAKAGWADLDAEVFG